MQAWALPVRDVQDVWLDVPGQGLSRGLLVLFWEEGLEAVEQEATNIQQKYLGGQRRKRTSDYEKKTRVSPLLVGLKWVSSLNHDNLPSKVGQPDQESGKLGFSNPLPRTKDVWEGALQFSAPSTALI